MRLSPFVRFPITLFLLALSLNFARAQGELTNGSTYTGAISPGGDFDTWTFSATNGDSILIKLGKITSTNGFTPRIRLFNPNSTQQALISSTSAAEITVTATNTGTFTVIVDDVVSTTATGTYVLTLVKTGSAVVISPGDEGGPLTNGYAQPGNLPVGDLDAWTFTANVGEAIVLKVGQMSDTNNFDPWVRLYGPDGALLGSDADVSAAEVTFRATNSGTFLVVIGNNPYYNAAGSGTYLLTLAKTGSPIAIVPGGEGGSLSESNIYYNGSLPIGGVDLWTFTICNGEAIDVRADEISQTNTFDPWVRIYGPSGILIGSNFGTTFGEVALTVTNAGRFLVLISNNPYNNDGGSGTYKLTVNGLWDGFKTCNPIISGALVDVGGVGGTPGTNAVLFSTTNIVTPISLWAPIRTNQFDQFGVFQYTNGFNPTERQRFYRLSQQ